MGDERPKIVDAFADADEQQRNRPLTRDRRDDPAFRSAVELGQHESGEAERVVEGLHLRERVLPRIRIQHQQHLVRRALECLAQNALAQVKAFDEALGLTGLVLTKLDGTAKGGVVCAIAKQRPVPLYFVGVGEGIDDLRPFSAAEFSEALLD